MKTRRTQGRSSHDRRGSIFNTISPKVIPVELCRYRTVDSSVDQYPNAYNIKSSPSCNDIHYHFIYLLPYAACIITSSAKVLCDNHAFTDVFSSHIGENIYSMISSPDALRYRTVCESLQHSSTISIKNIGLCEMKTKYGSANFEITLSFDIVQNVTLCIMR
jgi:hypothetical protein